MLFSDLECIMWYKRVLYLEPGRHYNFIEFVLDIACLFMQSDRLCVSFSSDASVLRERLRFPISSPAFNFIWFGLVTDLCVSAELPLKANIACNLTLPY